MSGAIGYGINAATSGTGPWAGRRRAAMRDGPSLIRTWSAPCGPGGPTAARAAGIPAYVVLHDATVAALASLRPRNTEELLRVPGLGPVKASRYGPTLLSLLCDRAAAG